MTVDGIRGPRTAAATREVMRRKALRLIEDLTPRLDTLADEELTGLLLTVFDAIADRARVYTEAERQSL